MASWEEQVRTTLKEDWEFLLNDNPEWCTQIGDHKHDHLLQDLSPESWTARAAHAEKTAARLRDLLDAAGSTDLPIRRTAQAVRWSAELEAECVRQGDHLVAPLNSIGFGGVHMNFVETVEWMVTDTPEGAAQLRSRLQAFPKQVSGFIALLRDGLARGFPPSRETMRLVPDQIKGLMSDSHPNLEAAIKAAPEGSQKELRDAVAGPFRDGLQQLLDFVQSEYQKSARETAGLHGLSGAADRYRRCLLYHTTTEVSPEELHELGKKEVARIQQRYRDDVLQPLGFKGTLAEFTEELRTGKEWYFDSQEALHAGYVELVARIEASLPKYFEKLPKAQLEVVARPSANGPAGYYMQGTQDGSRPGRFLVNTSNLPARPKYEMVALALHEGAPGHHTQGMVAIENEQLQPCERFSEDRRYEYCPGRRCMHTGYLEGWALYCEHLGEEMGMYSTPHSLFGRLSMEMMRAVRLVVDSGIHALGWTVQEAVLYMMEQTGMHRHECESECERYAAWPGQACAYKVGELALKRLRAELEETLGSKFDLKAFHRIVLDAGTTPLDVLADIVRAEMAKL